MSTAGTLSNQTNLAVKAIVGIGERECSRDLSHFC